MLLSTRLRSTFIFLSVCFLHCPQHRFVSPSLIEKLCFSQHGLEAHSFFLSVCFLFCSQHGLAFPKLNREALLLSTRLRSTFIFLSVCFFTLSSTPLCFPKLNREALLLSTRSSFLSICFLLLFFYSVAKMSCSTIDEEYKIYSLMNRDFQSRLSEWSATLWNRGFTPSVDEVKRIYRSKPRGF